MMVRALADVYVEGGYRRAGDVFAYAGPADPHLAPAGHEFEGEASTQELARRVALPQKLPPLPPAAEVPQGTVLLDINEVARRQRLGAAAQPEAPPASLDTGVTSVRLPATSADDGRDLLT